MVLTSDKERVKSLIQDTLSLLCRNGLNFNKQFCIEALVGVTIDEDDVFLVNIKETVKSDKAIEEERLAEEAARLAEEVRQRQEEDRANTSSPSQSVSSTSYSVKHAQRKRQRDSAANESDTVDSDMFDSYSEPSEKRSFMEAGNVKRERLEQEDEDELVFVKEEPREDNSFQDQYGGHPGPSWNNPLPPVSQYNTQSSSHDMLQHPPLPPGAAGDMQYPQTQTISFVRKANRPRKHRNYSADRMEDAIRMVKELNVSISIAAQHHGVPKTTLQDRIRNLRRKGLFPSYQEKPLIMTDFKKDNLDPRMSYFAPDSGDAPMSHSISDGNETPDGALKQVQDISHFQPTDAFDSEMTHSKGGSSDTPDNSSTQVKSIRKTYTADQMEDAIRMVKELNVSISLAATHYGIPKTTLEGRIRNLRKKGLFPPLQVKQITHSKSDTDDSPMTHSKIDTYDFFSMTRDIYDSQRTHSNNDVNDSSNNSLTQNESEPYFHSKNDTSDSPLTLPKSNTTDSPIAHFRSDSPTVDSESDIHESYVDHTKSDTCESSVPNPKTDTYDSSLAHSDNDSKDSPNIPKNKSPTTQSKNDAMAQSKDEANDSPMTHFKSDTSASSTTYSENDPIDPTDSTIKAD